MCSQIKDKKVASQLGVKLEFKTFKTLSSHSYLYMLSLISIMTFLITQVNINYYTNQNTANNTVFNMESFKSQDIPRFSTVFRIIRELSNMYPTENRKCLRINEMSFLVT